ncbi:MAG: hypothetical protein CVU38_03825 [Chloroflexi bacterium HGW-Chloroflexi-1]|nr:MAG: hypothetical protein CVU38_03825 [Chloroflexi bacterium HGW-Chloroflexi-1]
MNHGDGRRRLFFQAQIWLGLLLGLGALYLGAQAIDFQQLGRVLGNVRLPFVALTLITSLSTPVLKAVRWRWLFYPQRPPLSLARLASQVVIGQAINFMIPGRWGELARAYLAGDEAGISKAYVLGTLAAEKLLDLVVLALLVVAMLPFIALPDWLATRVGPVVISALVVTVGAAALLGGRGLWLKIADRALRLLPPATAARWQGRIVAGLDGLTALGSPRAAIAIWSWTAVFWLMAATTNWLLLLAFDLPPSPLIALFVLAVLQGGVAIPSTPGKIGVFHYLCILALSVFGVSASSGFGYGLVLHFLVVGGISLWAAAALWRWSWNLRQLAAASTNWR